MRRIRVVLLFVVFIVNSIFSVVHAVPLSLIISDPLGDNTQATDLTSVEMFFDNDTGAYAIFYNADPSNPFTGNLNINVNLRNISVYGTSTFSPDFSDTLNFIYLSVDTAQIELTGNSAALLNWNLGDEIAYINPGPGGFATNGAPGDGLGPSYPDSPMLTTFVTGVNVPESSTLLLMVLGLVGLGFSRKRNIS